MKGYLIKYFISNISLTKVTLEGYPYKRSAEEGYMPRVPITVLGYRCERCGHEWVPKNGDHEPVACPKCKSPYWNRPRKATSMLTYEDFCSRIKKTLAEGGPLTWTEIRTIAKLPEKFPNNKWVRRMETEIGLKRDKDKHGIIKWTIR